MAIFLIKLFGFLDFKIIDLIDILLVAVLIFFLYKLVRGTIAFNIFIGLISIYLVWWIVQAFEMSLLSKILGQFIGVGVLALLIVFQQEIRKFLLVIGQNNIFVREDFKLSMLLPWNWRWEKAITLSYDELLKTCRDLSLSKTGALIVISKSSELRGIRSTGVNVDAELSAKLLKTLFFKNSPLHDGAVILVKNKIKAASCILPVSENNTIPDQLGLRHRAALGISEQSDAVAIVISEETGSISLTENGSLKHDLTFEELEQYFENSFMSLNA